MNSAKLQEYIKYLKENPCLILEDLLGRKLHWYEKSYLKYNVNSVVRNYIEI